MEIGEIDLEAILPVLDLSELMPGDHGHARGNIENRRAANADVLGLHPRQSSGPEWRCFWLSKIRDSSSGNRSNPSTDWTGTVVGRCGD